MMMTPESTERAGCNRLQLEVTPNILSSGGDIAGDGANGHTTPGKGYLNLHFNSQQYRTPSSRARDLHCRRHIATPLSGTPPNIAAISGGLHVTPRGVSRPLHVHQMGTPCSYTGSSGGSRDVLTPRQSVISTPNGILYNPFDIDPEKMKDWVLSPGMFATKPDAEKSASPFWSIDHIALMKPMDIDERGVRSTRLMGLGDPEMEERAQQAIDQFFATNDLILPSPWSEDNGGKRVFQCPQTPLTPGVVQMNSPIVTSSCSKNNENVKDVSCQTALTVPMDVDLQKILGKYYLNDSGKEDGTTDSLSTSSLRRKLFFHGEDSAPPSPVQEPDLCDRSQSRQAPVVNCGDMCSTPEAHKVTSLQTSNLNLICSSPIQSGSDSGSHSSSIRRCSTAPNLVGSPALSPIGSTQKTVNHQRIAKNCGYTSDSAPLCEPLQATPSSDWSFIPLTIPGVSPIRLEMSTSGSMNETSSGQRRRPGSPKASSKPCARLRLSCDEGSLADTEPIYHSSQLLSPPAISDDKPMEVDFSRYSREEEPNNFCSGGGFTALRGCMAFSDSNTDPLGDQLHSTQVGALTGIGQDTGYQTNSLQSMNQQDIIGCHSNLTNQFGNLPLSSREEGYVSSNTSSIIDFNNPPIDCTNLFSSTRIPSQQSNSEEWVGDLNCAATKHRLLDEDDVLMSRGNMLDESLILRQARKALGKPEMDEHGSNSNSVSLERNRNIATDQCDVYVSEIQSHWKLNVPTPLRKKLHEVGLIDTPSAVGKNCVLPSSIALKALQRADDDVKTYCHFPGLKPDVIKPLKPNIVLKEFLVPDFRNPAFVDIAPYNS